MSHSVGFWATVIGMAVAFLIGLVALVRAVQWKGIWTALAAGQWSKAQKVILAACPVLVAGGVGLLATGTVTSRAPQSDSDYSIKFEHPMPSNSGNPLPQVSCNEDISVTAHIPSNDTVVMANRITNEPSWYFQLASPGGDTWTATINFGSKKQPNKAQAFQVEAFALPETLADYITSVYAAVNKSSDGWWDYSALPPPSLAVFTVQEQVQRSTSTEGCS
jgi:hypothetical protein